MLSALILVIGWNVGATGVAFGASLVVAAPIGALVIVWLMDHLHAPDVHG